ncbi:MAG TPA: amino acid adenylation domain-containing protein [Ktedonosporobacter sp.]|jgi:amino acid adenylation domain-containing protein|nr:amino acid adenylation domain-containing protein [Ktedonosporobacter sp.]
MAFLLSDLLTASSQRYPAKIAISYAENHLSYAELDRLANKFGQALLLGGLEAGDLVGIYAHKSLRTVVAILGVLRVGGVYVPLDPTSPGTRIATICSDCQIKFILTDASFLPTIQTIKAEKAGVLDWVGVLDDGLPDPPGNTTVFLSWKDFPETLMPLPRPQIVENDLAYILYTSGSTGIPKGVMISHRNALAFVEWGAAAFSVSAQDRLSSHAPFHFDLSIFDIFVALAAGATLALIPLEISFFPLELVKWIEQQQITIWYSVPSILKMILLYGKPANANLTSLRQILFAGEVFPLKYLRELMNLLPAARFYNLYGPTETNVCTYYLVPYDVQEDIPIGYACEHSDVFAVCTNGDLVQEVGDEGELYVRGATIMRGYWNNEQATQKVLYQTLPCKSRLAGPFYRTGDMVRLGANGAFYFLGRQDHQVKSRGYRIELGEIEAVLNAHCDIEQAVVVPLPDEIIGNRLEACVVLTPGTSTNLEDIRHHCALRLPRYMVPAKIHIYPSFPLTATAKVDRMQLRADLLQKEQPIGKQIDDD